MAEDLERLLAPWDRNPWLERLEQHRVYNLARFYAETQALEARIVSLEQVNERKVEWMWELADSRAFKLAEGIARLRGGEPWRQQLRALIDDRG